MKHQAINSLKFKLLARRLRVPLWQAVGLLESIWLLAQHDARDGDLTHHGAAGIAAWVEYDGDAEDLVAALVGDVPGHGWLDWVDGRLVIHDWAEHRPNWLKGLDASSATKKGSKRSRKQTPADAPDEANDSRSPSASPSATLGAALSETLSVAPSATPSATPPETLDLKPETRGGSTPPTPPASAGDRRDRDRPERAPLPKVLDAPEFREVLARWKAYKGRKYRPKGLQSLLTRAAKLAGEHGLPNVLERFERAMSNGWDGWEHEGPRQRASPAAAGAGPRTRNGNAIVPFPKARQQA